MGESAAVANGHSLHGRHHRDHVATPEDTATTTITAWMRMSLKVTRMRLSPSGAPRHQRGDRSQPAHLAHGSVDVMMHIKPMHHAHAHNLRRLLNAVVVLEATGMEPMENQMMVPGKVC